MNPHSMNPHSIRVVPNRDDAQVVVPGSLATSPISTTISGLTDAPRHPGQLPAAEEQRVILAYVEIMPDGAPHG